MPPALTLLAVVASLAAMTTTGSLTALATLLPAREATWRAGCRLVGVAGTLWAGATVGLVVAAAPSPAGASLADAASGAAIAGFAAGDGAPLALSAVAAGLVATLALTALHRPLAAFWLLTAAAVAAAPLAALLAGTGVAALEAVSGAAGAGERGAGLAVLAGSPRATAALAVWVVLVAAGAWLGGWCATRLVRPPGADAAVATGRVRRLGAWAGAVSAVALAAGTAAVLLADPADPADPAGRLAAGTVAVTGREPPPFPLTPWRALTLASPDLLWLLLVAGALVGYLLAVRRLRHGAADAWPTARTAAWAAGCLLLAWVTSGGLAAYTSLLLSAHLLALAAAAAVVAPLLAAGAPVRLLRRVRAPREDGSAGLRECVDAIAATRVAAGTRHPAVALVLAAVLVGTAVATAALPLALGTLAGHELALVAALGAGALLARSASPPPLPAGAAVAAGDRRRATLTVAAGTALATAAGCGWLATSQRLLAAGWFTDLGLGVDALADQRAGALAAGSLVLGSCAAWASAALARGRRRRVESHSDL